MFQPDQPDKRRLDHSVETVAEWRNQVHSFFDRESKVLDRLLRELQQTHGTEVIMAADDEFAGASQPVRDPGGAVSKRLNTLSARITDRIQAAD